MKKIGIIGLGLIGGSIARHLIAQKSELNPIDIYIWNHSDRMYPEVNSLGAISCKSLSDLFSNQPDLVFICTPIENLDDTFSRIANILEFQNNTTTIIADIASVKEYPRQLADKYSLSQQYIGVHPMFGTEKTGWENSSAEMGNNATWAICPALNDKSRVLGSKVSKFIRENLSGKTITLDAKEHDKAVAYSSHLPHIFAYELAAQVCEPDLSDREQLLVEKLSAGSYHGITRVAQGNEKMFEGMLTYNRHNLADRLDEIINDFTRLRNTLKIGQDHRLKQDIYHFIHRSDKFRQGTQNNKEENQTNNDNTITPIYRHKADGWVNCQCGRQHWGLNGAAGLLLFRFVESENSSSSPKAVLKHSTSSADLDFSNSTSASLSENSSSSQNISINNIELLLQHRALWTAEGGTWGTPGGAIDKDETPVEGGIREAHEEAGVYPEDIKILETVTRDHGDWAYTTVIGREKPGHTVIPQCTDQESLEVKWVPVSEILKENSEYTLLKAFGKELPELLEIILKYHPTI